MPTEPCPDPTHWRALLRGTDPGPELTDHLATCGACQLTLEELAGDGRFRAEAARYLVRLPVPEPELEQAVAELVADPVGAPDATVADPPALPEWLDHYEVLGAVGRGGMGVVRRAFVRRAGQVNIGHPQGNVSG